jgi:hypothetical protein
MSPIVDIGARGVRRTLHRLQDFVGDPPATAAIGVTKHSSARRDRRMHSPRRRRLALFRLRALGAGTGNSATSSSSRPVKRCVAA